MRGGGLLLGSMRVNVDNSDSDVDVTILDVMDGDSDNQLDLNDQSDPNMTCARVRIFVHQ